MKKILFISAIAVMLITCKKKDTTPTTTQTNPTPTPTTVTQDSRLLGTWIQDSMKIDGMNTYYNAIDDTISISSIWKSTLNAYFSPYYWETTPDDSVFVGGNLYYLDNMYANFHYKYSFAGNILLLYENKFYGGKAVKFWYHKK